MNEHESSPPDAIGQLPPPRPAEQAALTRILERLADLPSNRVLCTTIGRGQAALALAMHASDREVDLHFLDLHECQASQHCLNASNQSPSNLRLWCQSDFPNSVYDLAVLPSSMHGDAELMQEQLQEAFDRLTLGGHLVTAVDNPDDAWLGRQSKQLGGETRRIAADDATVYITTKTKPLAKRKSFECEFAFRDGDRLVRAISRPGVFAHRRLDGGARQLLAHTDPPTGSRVLDLGCGCGAVGIALALRRPLSVHAIDSHARAVTCTERGARLNGIDGLVAELSCDGLHDQLGTFDWVVANPPYYAQHRIAERFLQFAAEALRPGGELRCVTKDPKWYDENMPPSFENLGFIESKAYWIVKAVRS